VLTALTRGFSQRNDLSELRKRAGQIRMVVTDCDGVLTDGGVYYSQEGEALKRFSVRDGMGVERLRLAGIETAILTRENSPIVARRGEKLKLRFTFLGIQDKHAHLSVMCKVSGLDQSQLAYIGDDVNDLEIIRAVGDLGLTAAPSDATDEVAAQVQFRCSKPGGHGAFREFAEWVLHLREMA
jgi:3-deoxy-D-manno-octulosonate 8-phosphate phosphatase (KDO 8-P phosphatase)